MLTEGKGVCRAQGRAGPGTSPVMKDAGCSSVLAAWSKSRGSQRREGGKKRDRETLFLLLQLNSLCLFLISSAQQISQWGGCVWGWEESGRSLSSGIGTLGGKSSRVSNTRMRSEGSRSLRAWREGLSQAHGKGTRFLSSVVRLAPRTAAY